MPTDEQLYVSVEEIKNRMGTATSYSDDTIKEIIIRMMDYVDEITACTFNTRRKRMREIHSIDEMGYDKTGFYFSAGYQFYLTKSNIDTVESIKIIYSNPDDYRDLIEENPEPDRYDRWWMDKFKGVVYLKTFLLSHGGKEVDITYTYGIDLLPPEIKELTMLLVMRELYLMDRTIAGFPEINKSSDANFINYMDKRITELVLKVRDITPALCGLSVKYLGEII
jgi:hypothetical protein